MVQIIYFFTPLGPDRNTARDEMRILKSPAERAGPKAALRNRHASFTWQLKQLSTDLGNCWGENKTSLREPGRTELELDWHGVGNRVHGIRSSPQNAC